MSLVLVLGRAEGSVRQAWHAQTLLGLGSEVVIPKSEAVEIQRAESLPLQPLIFASLLPVVILLSKRV